LTQKPYRIVKKIRKLPVVFQKKQLYTLSIIRFFKSDSATNTVGTDLLPFSLKIRDVKQASVFFWHRTREKQNGADRNPLQIAETGMKILI